MEAGIGGEAQLYYGMASTDLRAVSKRSLEWDPSDWRWDGDLFIATPLKRAASSYQSKQLFPLETGISATRASSNTSSSYSEELNRDTRELEKKRRANAVENNNLGENLTLDLGGRCFATAGNGEATAGKKTKLGGAASNRAACQVEDCGADLSKAKDYHRRHKVCQMHSKASKALVGNQMQRFCQQCSRSVLFFLFWLLKFFRFWAPLEIWEPNSDLKGNIPFLVCLVTIILISEFIKLSSL